MGLAEACGALSNTLGNPDWGNFCSFDDDLAGKHPEAPDCYSCSCCCSQPEVNHLPAAVPSFGSFSGRDSQALRCSCTFCCSDSAEGKGIPFCCCCIQDSDFFICTGSCNCCCDF